MADAELTARVSVEDAASAPLRRIEGQVESLGREMQTASAQAGRSAAQWSAAFNVMAQGAQAAFSAIGAGIGHVVQTSGQLEQANLAFTTMLGSAERAQAFLSEMQQFAAQTPFQFTELVDASKRMLAFGFAAEQVKPLLTAVGNAAAAMGTGAEGITRITTALGQMQAKGKATAEEMMQLTEAGIPAWQMLADTLGTDVAGAMDAVEKRTVSAATAIEAFQTGVGARFGDMMAAQARTFEGALSTLTDTAEQAAVRGFAPLFEVVKDVTVALADLAQAGAFEGWVAQVEAGSARAAAALRQIPVAGAGLHSIGTQIEQQTGLGTAAGQAAEATGFQAGEAFATGYKLAIATLLPQALIAQELWSVVYGRGEPIVAAQGQQVGEDFVENVAAGIAATAPRGADAMAALVDQLVAEFEGRGFDPDTARAAAATYVDAALAALAAKRPDMTLAGEALGGAVADGLQASTPLVGAAAQSLAETAGAALAAMRGNVQAGVAEAIRVATEAGFSETATQSLVAETLQQANATKALTEALHTLTPVERARWEVLRSQTNDQHALNTMLQEGRLTQEQYTNAVTRGTTGLTQQTAATQTATRANEALATSYTHVAAAAERVTSLSRQSFSWEVAQGQGPPGHEARFGNVPGAGARPAGTRLPSGEYQIGNQTLSAEQYAMYQQGQPQAIAAHQAGANAAQQAGAGGGISGIIGRPMQAFGNAIDGATQATKANTDATKGNTLATEQGRRAIDAEWRKWTNQITATEALQQDAAEAARYATANLVQLTVGTGLASSSASALAGNLDDLGRTAGDVAKAMQQEWTILQANAQALRSGSMLVGGMNVGAGYLPGQIYGPGGGGFGGSHGNPSATGFQPGNYYGLPVVSPVTPGTLRGYASGGWITEPSYLTSMRTGQTYGLVGEAGAEPVGGGGTVNVVINASGVDALRDRQFWRQVVNEQLRFALKEAGLVS